MGLLGCSRRMDHGRTFTDMQRIGQCEHWLVVRTDFSDESAWESVKKQVLKPSAEDGFMAYVDFLEDRRHESKSRDEVLGLIEKGNDGYSCGYIVIADAETMRHAEHPLLVVDVDPDGVGEFRCVPGEMYAVENNLDTGNMGFEDFVRVLDADGIFRGNWENDGLYQPKPESIRQPKGAGASAEPVLFDEGRFRVSLPGNMKISREGDLFMAVRGDESFMVNLMQDEDFYDESRRMILQKNMASPVFEITFLKQGEMEGKHHGIEAIRRIKHTHTGNVSAFWMMLIDIPGGKKATIQISVDPYSAERMAKWEHVVETLEFE